MKKNVSMHSWFSSEKAFSLKLCCTDWKKIVIDQRKVRGIWRVVYSIPIVFRFFLSLLFVVLHSHEDEQNISFNPLCTLTRLYIRLFFFNSHLCLVVRMNPYCIFLEIFSVNRIPECFHRAEQKFFSSVICWQMYPPVYISQPKNPFKLNPDYLTRFLLLPGEKPF